MKIIKVNAVTPIQSGMLFQYMLTNDKSSYMGTEIFDLEGNIDPEIFESVIEKISNEYEVFRTNIIYDKIDEPKSVVIDKRRIPFKCHIAKDLAEKNAVVKEINEEQFKRGFDIQKESLIRLDLVQTVGNSSIIFTFHHIIMDGYCAAMIADIIMKNYGRILGRTVEESDGYVPFSKYQEWIVKQDISQSREYWKEYLKDVSPIQSLELVQFDSDSVKNNGHSFVSTEFTSDETKQMLKLAAKNNVTLNIYMQWLWGVALCRNFSVDKAVFGTVVSFRPAEFDGAERVLGPMINTVPVVFRYKNDVTISRQLKEFSKSFVRSMENSWIGLGEISKAAEECESLIDHLFVYDNFPEMDFDSIEDNTGFKVSNFKLEERTEYALTLEVSKAENVRIRFNYDSNVYSGESIERLIRLYKNICLGSLCAEYPNDIVNISSEQSNRLEKQKINVYSSYKKGSIVSVFDKTVKEFSESIALEYNGKTLSYSELDLMSDALAWKLHSSGITEGARIAVDITPSFEVIIAMLAAIKLGGCYVPFDMMLPEKRLKELISDAGIDILLTVGEKDTELYDIRCAALNAEDLKGISVPDNEVFRAERNEETISNIMFTSGTTSKPKGVVLNDGGILGLVFSNSIVDYSSITCQFQNSSIAFDAATFEIWGGLLNGKKLVIIDKETLLSDERFAQKLKENKGCCLFLTTTLFNNFAERNASMFSDAAYVVTGGEKFSEAHGKLFIEACPGTHLINGYGPTESTAFTTCFEITSDSLKNTVPIGTPIETRGVMICDSNMTPLPEGSKGEIIIYGQGLAQGYCGDSATTAEKFLKLADGMLAYKSGDYGYIDDVGNTYFCTRQDEQLKLRGFRISTEEIESALRECSDVVNSAVIPLRNKNNNMYLAAYIVLKDKSDSLSEVQGRITAQLGKILPYYMIPSEFIAIDELPVNSNGKLDKSRLKKSEICSEDFVYPVTETEKQIYELFKNVITECEFGMEQSFINIGGDSIKAMKLTSAARKMGFDITVADLYREQTPARLALFIESKEKIVSEELKDIVPDKEHRYEKFPLNNVQVAYLSGRSRDLVLGGYGTVFFSDMEGNYNREHFSEVLNALIKRHDMLRAVIFDSGHQQILPPDKAVYDIKETDISDMSVDEQEKYIGTCSHELKNIVFETGKWPMYKVEMIRTSPDNVHVLYAFDALIMDAFSVIMLAEELKNAYEGHMIREELDLSFRDYVLETAKMQEEYEKDKQFWISRTEDFPSAPALKFKTLPENIKSTEFSRKHMCFDNDVWQNLKSLSVQLNITPAILLCGLYSYTLSLFSGQSKLAVNLTVFSREQIHSQVDKILGDFTKIVLLDYDFAKYDRFSEVLSNSHDRLNEYLNHLHFDGIDFMRELVRANKPVNGRPLMPVVFTSALFDNDMVYDYDKAASRTPQVYLDCQAMLQCGRLNIVWDYPSELYDSEMIDKMFGCFTEFILNAESMLSKRFPISAETEKFYYQYNNTAWEHRKLTLQQMVRESLNNPEYEDNIWLYDEDKCYTYKQTREQVYRYAAHLQSEGICCGDFVCVEGEREASTLFKMLAAVLCGAAYIPVQPSWPEERKAVIRQQSGCKYMFDVKVQIGDGNFEYMETAPDAPAYVIYTSGSTGKPKGVLINQSAVVNTIMDINDRYSVTEKDVFAAVSSFSFDLSVYDIFGSLYSGSGMTLIPDMKNVKNLISRLERDKATIWNTVPALMGILVSELERRTINGSHFDIPLRLALMSGDWIPVGLPKAVGRIFSGIHTVSLGGATEASVWSIAYDIDTDREYSVHIPYGYPLRNQQMYVLSETLEPLPENVEGDIFIGGDGVADGYQNDRIQTDKAFIVHERYGRIYRTGDYGYISNEGCMEFCGRKDFQVKINGLRIELGDIDSTVKKIAGIKDSISTVQTNESGGDFLCTYVQPDWKDNRREIADGFSPEQMKEHEHTIMSEFNIEKYSVLISTLERFCVDCMAESLVQLGIDKLNGERISVSDILERLKIADNRHVNFRQWFNTLRENDIIGYKDGIFRFYAEKIESPDVPYRQLNEYGIPDYMEQIMNYIIQSRKKLSEIMLGNVDPISEMFFKDSSLQIGVGVYRNSITGQIYGRLAAELTAELAEANKDRSFRILEVGAGVGGTSDYIIERIKKLDNVSYMFTDLSDIFLDEAHERYSDCDFVDYRIYDINKHPKTQSMPMHSFDLIIGANVFHDAHNIDSVVNNMHLLLAEDGKLMIIETTVNTAAQMITAGFAEGLTAYDDDRVETDLPAYSEEQWINCISKNCYTKPVLFPYDGKVRASLQTALILSQSRQTCTIIDEIAVIDTLKDKLPDYMIPRFVIEVQKFPLTDNGKVDVKSLPEMSIASTDRVAVVPPETELQAKLLELWKENLNVQDMGITDNYFAMGGDSLKAIRLMSRLGESGYHIDMNAVFRCTTVQDMAAEIESNVK